MMMITHYQDMGVPVPARMPGRRLLLLRGSAVFFLAAFLGQLALPALHVWAHDLDEQTPAPCCGCEHERPAGVHAAEAEHEHECAVCAQLAKPKPPAVASVSERAIATSRRFGACLPGPVDAPARPRLLVGFPRAPPPSS